MKTLLHSAAAHPLRQKEETSRSPALIVDIVTMLRADGKAESTEQCLMPDILKIIDFCGLEKAEYSSVHTDANQPAAHCSPLNK